MNIEDIRCVLIIGAGTMGIKTGRGFYTYPDPGLYPPRLFDR
jgi:3-hydroxyacyl-CoA dehydrogenase